MTWTLSDKFDLVCLLICYLYVVIEHSHSKIGSKIKKQESGKLFRWYSWAVVNGSTLSLFPNGDKKKKDVPASAFFSLTYRQREHFATSENPIHCENKVYPQAMSTLFSFPWIWLKESRNRDQIATQGAYSSSVLIFLFPPLQGYQWEQGNVVNPVRVYRQKCNVSWTPK